MARLVIVDDCVRAVDLPDHAVIVGRSQKVDVPIRDPLLPRKHLTISPVSEDVTDSNGSRFRLMDLKSANGTFVNGQPLAADPAQIGPGDNLVIGDLSFTYRSVA